MSNSTNQSPIAILLSTYNGERYIKTLIESILNQSYQNFILYIRDDGSQDSTLAIIKNFCKNHSNIVLIESNENLGSKYSFLKMLSLIESDYYMFCDQDDIWLPFKIECTFNEMKKWELSHPGIPIIVHTDLKVVDSELNIKADSFWQYRRISTNIPHTFNLLCHYNDVTGCVMMINKETKSVCAQIFNLELPKFLYHDAIISIIAAKSGGFIIPLKKATILYRRHEGNETDAITKHLSSIRTITKWSNAIKEQKLKHQFFRKIGYGSFPKFLFYRVIYVILRFYYSHFKM